MAFQKDIDKGNDEVIRVEVSEFRSQKFLNIRIWYKDKEGGKYKPTQKGVAIRPDLYPELKKAVLEAEEEVTETPKQIDEAPPKPIDSQ